MFRAARRYMSLIWCTHRGQQSGKPSSASSPPGVRKKDDEIATTTNDNVCRLAALETSSRSKPTGVCRKALICTVSMGYERCEYHLWYGRATCFVVGGPPKHIVHRHGPCNHLPAHRGGTNRGARLRGKILDFGGLDGPGRPGNILKRWGASPPTFFKGFPAAPGRPDPPNPGFSL